MTGTEAPAGAAESEYRSRLRADLARELHDGPIQTLTESVLRLEGYRGAAAGSAAMQAAISDVEESVRIALMSLRNLIRELRDEPPTTDVACRVRELAGRYQASTEVEIAVVTAPAWPSMLPVDTAVNLIRIVHEAITNAVRHSGAKHILVELQADDTTMVVAITDDGCGFPVETPPGAGWVGMHERAALLGGKLLIRSRDPGTEVRVEVPLP